MKDKNKIVLEAREAKALAKKNSKVKQFSDMIKFFILNPPKARC
jgi:hypothetical protein